MKLIYNEYSLPMILILKYIANDFNMEMHWKWFYHENAFKMILLWEISGNDYVSLVDFIIAPFGLFNANFYKPPTYNFNSLFSNNGQ